MLADSLTGVAHDKVAVLEVTAEAEKIGLVAEDLMSEAGRKVFSYYFARMLKHEPNVQKEADPDSIHDMRVATRRLRSMIKLFQGFYHRRTLKPYTKTLKKVAQALGDVRDLQVFQADAREYLKDHPDSASNELESLLDDWHYQLDTACSDLRQLLSSERYLDFVKDFTDFITTPGQGAISVPISGNDKPFPFQVRHVAPTLIYKKYEIVRAYETLLEDASLDVLHDLRIDTKRLRYTLETFQEVLGNQAEEVIEQAKAVQDHLGNLQDARIACILIRDFISSAGEEKSMIPVLNYLSQREEQKQQLWDNVPDVWKAFTRAGIRRGLALSISVL